MPRASEFTVQPQALAGRVVLVTGAHGGLGTAVSKAAAAAGATVVLLGRRVPKLNRLYDAIEQSGAPQPAIFPMDLEGATPADYAQLADSLRQTFGRLDGIVHAAAEFKGLKSIGTTEPEDFLRDLHVNVSAPWMLTRACLPLLAAAPDASVVFALQPLESLGAYWGGFGVAQHALRGVLAVMSDELENTPVRVSAVQPGPMRTPIRARVWFGEDPATVPPPDRYAPAVVHLLSSAGADLRGRVLTLGEG